MSGETCTVTVPVNGPFGIGKTTTAHELVRLRPNAIRFDPELTGAFLRHLLGPLAADADYQDLPLWRSLFIDLAGQIRATYGYDLIVPMCLWRRDYLEAIRTPTSPASGWLPRGRR